MTARFGQSFGVSTVLHVAVVAILLVQPLWKSIFRPRTELSIPVEFVIEVPASMLKQSEPRGMTLSQQRSTKDANKDGIRKTKKNPVQVNNKIIVRDTNKKKVTPTKKLTEEEVRKWLNAGATAGNYTSIPEGDVLYREIVRRACYAAWNPPSYDEVKGAVAVVTLRFQSDGSVIGATLTKKTGIATMDVSVMEAANSLKRIEGLSVQYLENCDYEVDVKFRVTFE